MQIPAVQALVFLPFVLPICFYVAFTDLREMRITNQAVIVLAVIYLVLGPILMPLPEYGWGLIRLVAALVIGIMLNAGGAMGAGDAKFIAAAAPYIHPGDVQVLIKLLAAVLLAAVVTHRLAKYTPLKRLAPHWTSWSKKRDFPMGLALGGTLALYLILGAVHGV